MTSNDKNPLGLALKRSSAAFWGVGLFSCAVNILMLTAPLFMLQIYDRVLTSKSIPTLAVLFALVCALYGFLGLFEYLRKKVLARIGIRLDVDLMEAANKAAITTAITSTNKTHRPVFDLSVIRKFISSNGLPVLFDLPWIPFYLAIVYLLHFQLGLLATFGAIIVIILTIINEISTKKLIAETSQSEFKDSTFNDFSSRNGEAIMAMGMLDNITQHWQQIRKRALVAGQLVSDRTDKIAATTKTVRMLLQSSILALGAYLAIFQEITPGTMIAASILSGRALAPIDMAIGSWKNFVHARQSYARLKEVLILTASNNDMTQLPDPQGYLQVENLIKYIPQQTPGSAPEAILQGIKFQLTPGDGLGVIGPSGSGKSSLMRLLVGVWKPERGEVRLDDATYEQYERNALGRFIGYLPQSVELLPGSVSQNIARFDPEVTDEQITEATQLAGVHELILKLPNGYATEIGTGRAFLSGGQKQRIALARAVLNRPSLVILDEPHSNLDTEGDIALSKTIQTLRSLGSTVVVVAHRPSALNEMNKVLKLIGGKQADFGLKEDVISRMNQPPLPIKG